MSSPPLERSSEKRSRTAIAMMNQRKKITAWSDGVMSGEKKGIVHLSQGTHPSASSL